MSNQERLMQPRDSYFLPEDAPEAINTLEDFLIKNLEASTVALSHPGFLEILQDSARISNSPDITALKLPDNIKAIAIPLTEVVLGLFKATQDGAYVSFADEVLDFVDTKEAVALRRGVDRIRSENSEKKTARRKLCLHHLGAVCVAAQSKKAAVVASETQQEAS